MNALLVTLHYHACSTGAWISRGCGNHFVWEDNIAMGNFVGFNLEGGCHHLALESYKNSIAVAAHAVPYVSGFLAVEPAVGFISTAKLVIGPSEKCETPFARRTSRDSEKRL